MKKYIPCPRVFFEQVIFLIAFPFIGLSFSYNAFHGMARMISLSVSFTLWLIDLFLLLFSYFKWWNVPIIITEEGIINKNKTLYLWKNVSSIKYVAKGPSVNGPVYVRIVIKYNDGGKVSFDPYRHICKEICKMCTDEDFLKKFYACHEGYESLYGEKTKE